jgi:polyisoprenyl-phosphate glycosyltransferase
MNKKPVLGIIVPCYNEEEVISSSLDILLNFLNGMAIKNVVSNESFIGIVDDRSRDRSWDIIKSYTEKNKKVRALRFSANRGHQYAILAGIQEFNSMADCLVTVDADLQDDLAVIETMVGKFTEGNEIVYGVRNDRSKDTFLKRFTAMSFYRLLKSVLGVNIIYNHADFRLTGKKVNQELDNFKESNLFLRGIFPLMGFNTSFVLYQRKERMAGKTKYTFGKMIALALDGITSFSTVPLRIIIFFAFIIFILCVIMILYSVVSFLSGNVIPGWFSTVLPLYFLGGIQILCIGILGEYLGKIYREVKKRPRYTIDERT